MSKSRAWRAQERANQAAQLAEIQKGLADVVKGVPGIHHALEEVVEDNMALTRSVKSVGDNQELLRAAVCRELDLLRTEVAGELLSHALKTYCRELTPVLSAVERMLTDADLGDEQTTRQHLESLATTFRAALVRMGIERLSVAAGQDHFDSRLHDCVRSCIPPDSPVPDAPHGVVVYVQEHGYAVRGKVAQAAKVWVQQRHEPKIAQPEKETDSCDTTE